MVYQQRCFDQSKIRWMKYAKVKSEDEYVEDCLKLYHKGAPVSVLTFFNHPVFRK